MLAVFLIYLIIVFYKFKFTAKGTADYLAIENTTAVKGIFILMVFLSHFNSYIELNGRFDGIYWKIFMIIGQAMVALFMFYSGYGIMESVKKKGDAYISKIPFKRVLATLFKFDCAIILYFILGVILSTPMTVKQVLLSLIGWETLGNSNWYIFVILFLYLLTYVSFKLCGTKKPVFSAVVMSAFTCGAVLATMRFNIRPAYWYDTAFCFLVGLFYSLWKEKIVGIINRNIFIWITTVAISGVAFYVLRQLGGVFDMVANIFFTVLFVTITMRVTFNNKILNWCGEHLFEIYILQRIPMIIFGKFGIGEFNVYVYLILCIIITVLLTLGFRYVTGKAWSAVTAPKKCQKGA